MRVLRHRDPGSRHSGVLQRVAEIADSPVPEGRARGVAVHKSFNTYVAEIAEISSENALPRVHKVWCAVDCGVPVNPNIIRAQMEGGIGFGVGSLGDGPAEGRFSNLVVASVE